MKKATMQTIVNYIEKNEVEELFGVRDELNAELNKDAEQKAENAKLYDTAKAIVMDELATAQQGVTIAELYEAVANKLPEGFTKSKLQYGMTRLWKNELVRTEGKVNTYLKA